jgi:hypothetical protein
LRQRHLRVQLVPLGLPVLWLRYRREVLLGLRVLPRHRQEVRPVQEVPLDLRVLWHRHRQEHRLVLLVQQARLLQPDPPFLRFPALLSVQLARVVPPVPEDL